ncbi:serine/threonine-protein kinase [Streptomyces sp. NBC_01142]|uniref:serine/threonine-protein kinase n=1 Tax=Streptomyces sp. NBC_01142 TaxID=2975865 RepID=UPI00225A1C7F|nr:serine/threonine-protein kinase [Streptomyces sp. NBC_01142]MCX4819860.1 serine/threonine-protein kinase [Streptomyces sp. NBC_01142]
MAAFAPLEAGDPSQAGPYGIVGRLGSGGMGRVYLARSPGGRTVAVKIIREELADDPTFRRRFAREVQAARRVTGFFTAAVLDAAPEADPPWLATAYVPGLSLSEAVAARGAWPEQPVLALGTALAEALEAIHSAEVVHRDLKPSNVLLAADGPRVIDFGISVAADDTKLTLTGTAVGTPGYMPPEQLVGKDVGPAGDVFALGAVLAYAVTGTGPFAGGSAHGVNYRVVHEEPDLSRVPARLADVVAQCLAKDPQQRPSVPGLVEELGQLSAACPTAGVFSGSGWLPASVAIDITRIQAAPLPETATGTVPLKAPPADAPPAATDQSPAGAVPRTAIATAVVGAAPTAGLPASPPQPVSVGRLLGLPRRHALIGLAVAAVLAVLAATLLLPDGLLDGDRRNTQNKGSAAPATELAFEELWSYEKDPAGPPVIVDGKVYFGDHGGTLHALDTDSGTPVWKYGGLKGARPVTIADGVVYAFSGNSGALHSVDADTGDRRWSFKIDDASTGAAPKGTDYLFTNVAVAKGTVYLLTNPWPTGRPALYALDAGTGKELWNHPVDRGLSTALTVADGVIYCGLGGKDYENYLYALDADTGDQLWRIKTGGSNRGKVTSLSVAGSTVYFGSEEGTFYAADATNGEVRWKYRSESEDAEWTDPPLVSDGVVYASVKDRFDSDENPGRVYAFTANSGKRLWEHGTTGAASPPVLTGGAVHFSDAGTLQALDPRTGTSLGDAPLTTGTDPLLTVSGDRAYFDGGDERLHAGRISLTRD